MICTMNHYEYYEEYYEELNQLPRFIEKEICGKKVLFIHYEIENDKLSSPIDEVPFSPIVKDDEQEMTQLFADKDADLIIFGHNHRLHMFDDKNKMYFKNRVLIILHFYIKLSKPFLVFRSLCF